MGEMREWRGQSGQFFLLEPRPGGMSQGHLKWQMYLDLGH